MSHVFISYVHENSKEVERLCDALTAKGIKVWLDKNDIKPGSWWKDAILEAIENGDFFIACFSEEYNKKNESFMNEELTVAIERLRKIPRERAWFIPVVLSGKVPKLRIGGGQTLHDIQWVELYQDWDDGIQRILSVISPDISPPEEIISKKDNAPMMLIPAGEFEIGTDKDEIPELVEWAKKWYSSVEASWFEDETPRHTVYLDAFYIDKYEVTVGQYRKFIDDTGYSAPDWDRVSEYSPKDQHPMIYVSWYDAQEYCKWAGKRLPTEAEWEKAARGGLTNKIFPWGDKNPDGTQCNFADKNTDFSWSDKSVEDGYQYTAPVGIYTPNGYGLYDMAGNVWEWCADWYDSGYYSSSPSENPPGPASSERRVLRGGSWDAYPDLMRAACRDGDGPDNADGSVGFRCSQTVTP